MRGIKLDSLIRWLENLDINKSINQDIAKIQIDCLKDIINNYDEDTFHSKFYANMNQDFFEKFIKYDSHSIKIGNYYECFIKCCNSKTKKKIMKGFDYLDIGKFKIYKDGIPFAVLGSKSDLLWTTFYDSFIFTKYSEEEMFMIECTEHILPSHEEILSLSLYDVEYKDSNEIYDLINSLLIEISIKYDMEFDLYTPEKELQIEGDSPIIDFQHEDNNYDSIPMMYFKTGLNSSDYRLSFLSFYQVLEFYFSVAKSNGILKGLVRSNQNLSERKNLKLLLKEIISIEEFEEWINENKLYVDLYCDSNSQYCIDLSDEENTIEKIGDRIYDCRCSIAHAKNEPNLLIAVPTLSDDLVKQEIPLAKYFALKALRYYSC